MSKEFEDLLGQYWDLAHLEGKSGVSQGDKANEVLHALKKLAEQPAQQQEPVAWIEHEWSGTGLKHLHFERREPTLRDEVVNPVWTPLYTSPPAQRKPLTYVDLRRIANQCGLGANEVSARTQATADNYARAIEAAHGIKETT